MEQNPNTPRTLLIVGATGSVGRHVVAEAVRQGYDTHALVRESSRTSGLDPAARRVTGELTDASTLKEAVADIDAVIFTHGSSYGDAAAAEAVDYGAVKNVLQAVGWQTCTYRPYDGDWRHPAWQHARLEAAKRTADPRQRQRLHDCPTRLVRL
ncbi:NAD(P)H-binding protein [Arthrobacter sp. G.S.26]|uniref:NAD(P)H-binding protein n=1 Tax=Arthrobacter sp. G.S.26 TaxID=3433706 RepID=UPI003D775A1B